LPLTAFLRPTGRDTNSSPDSAVQLLRVQSKPPLTRHEPKNAPLRVIHTHNGRKCIMRRQLLFTGERRVLVPKLSCFGPPRTLENIIFTEVPMLKWLTYMFKFPIRQNNFQVSWKDSGKHKPTFVEVHRHTSIEVCSLFSLVCHFLLKIYFPINGYIMNTIF
jgi:hypothetical protein